MLFVPLMYPIFIRERVVSGIWPMLMKAYTDKIGQYGYHGCRLVRPVQLLVFGVVRHPFGVVLCISVRDNLGPFVWSISVKSPSEHGRI